MLKTIEQVEERLNNRKCRSAWDKGVNAYALELLDNLAAALAWQQLEQIPEDWKTCKADILNGADDWNAFSWGGSSLIYDYDIAERLCTPSELKRTKNGERKPNAREDWLDAQARALYQAWHRLYSTIYFD